MTPTATRSLKHSFPASDTSCQAVFHQTELFVQVLPAGVASAIWDHSTLTYGLVQLQQSQGSLSFPPTEFNRKVKRSKSRCPLSKLKSFQCSQPPNVHSCQRECYFTALRCWLLTVGIILIPRLCCWKTHCIMYSEDRAAKFPLSPASPFVASYVIQCHPSLPSLHTSTMQTFTNFLLLPPTSPSLPLMSHSFSNFILCKHLFYASIDLIKIVTGL